ncbi:MAG: hypothetical protein ACI8UR_001403 [Natronomonas sp.]|uniref:hypothetical protein n=1 Tax=Natronomonas sp. TaxID=2184060 RepID=UPI00398922F9
MTNVRPAVLANGEKNLGELVADLGSDNYHSVDDLRDELFEYLPEEALGEVGEAEGEG